MPLDQDHPDDRDAPTANSMMSFGDHLDELRHRLILSLAVPLPLMILLFPFADELRAILCAPVFEALTASGLPAQLQAMSPAETLGTNLKLSVIFALILTGPWILWQAWKFIQPGLYNQERHFVHLLLPGSAILTVSGLALLYYVMLPLMLRVLIAFGLPGDVPSYPVIEIAPTAETAPAQTIPILAEIPAQIEPGTVWISPHDRTLRVAMPNEDDPSRVSVMMVPLSLEGMVVQQYRLREYINFILMLMVGIAVAFQMPLVILLLGWVGIVRPETLRKQRKYALLVCAIVSAVITPADIVSMLLMLVPLYLLYELGILLLLFAPADRVAGGSVFKGAVEDVLGRFDHDNDNDDDDDNDNDNDDDDDEPDHDPDSDPDGGDAPDGAISHDPDVPLSYQQDDVPENLQEDDGFTESPEDPERPKQ